MQKNATLTATAAVATGISRAGLAIDHRRGGGRLATAVGTATGVAYVIGTLDPRSTLFGKAITTATGDPATFALTFDDGPDPRHTTAISRLLADRGHHATFFVLARAVVAHPYILEQLIADGHEIANHGADHRLLAFAGPTEIRRQLDACELAVLAATGRPPLRLFRPPHGYRSPWLTHVAEHHGYRICAWRGNVFDTAQPGANTIADRVEPLLQSGAIVLLHDGDGSGNHAIRDQTVTALPAILDLAEHLGLRSAALTTALPA